MKNLLLSCATAIGLATAASLAQPASAKVSDDAFPIEYWAAPEFMDNVSVSPNGKYVAFIKATSQNADNIIEVYETADMSKRPRRIGADSMDLRRFSWVGDEEMIVTFDRQVRSRIQGFNRGTRQSKIALYSMETGDFEELNDDDFALSLVDPLVNDPDRVLMRYSFFSEGQAFRAPSFYSYDLNTGSKRLVLKGNDDLFNYGFDEDGNPRLATRFDNGSESFVFLYRPVGGSGWTEYHRIERDSFENFTVQGLVDGEDDLVYVRAHNGHDRAGLWTFRMSTGEFEELVFRHPEVDVVGVTRHTNTWSNPDQVTGVVYATDKYHVEWFDRQEQAIREQFEAAIPNSHSVRITSRSRDGNVLVVRNSGPRDPGSFYLFNNGQFSKLGSVNGLLTADQLADVEYIQYTARDGRTIPAYLTRPNTPGPHPLIVMPHGGPFVQEVVGWDDWGQMFANQGYMVLQPQYRGSQGYGLDFYTSAFIEQGQGGFAMQDDKDDGVLHLIEQGEVDPDRVAMFGWSYGGYAALVAASREPNLYQCVIAGAAVADNVQQVNYYRDDIRGAQRVEQLKFWDESINPIDEAAKVNVPMLIIHGSVDQRVPVSHSRRYADELEDAGIQHEYIELEDADHFSNTLYYPHKMAAYPRMFEFLEEDCGPGGL